VVGATTEPREPETAPPPELRPATTGRSGGPLHVAMVLADLSGGGAERMIVHLAAGLAARQVRVDLVLARAEGPYLSEVPATVRVVDLGRTSVSAAIPALVRYLRQERPDALVATLRHVSLSAAIAHAVAAVDTVLFVREANTPSRRQVAWSDLKSHGVGLGMRWAYRRAHGVLAVSEGVAADLLQTQGVPADKVTLVHNPVVTPDLAVKAAVDPEHPWFGAGGPPVVLAVGSLQPKKDYPTLIEAFATLRTEREARLVILGEGPQRSALEALVRERGLQDDVDMPGFARNPFAFMARASVFALSSVLEGLPGVLIQALACGCPVVATDCPSGPYEILEGGRIGELVPMRDPAALAAALARVLDAPPDPAALRSRSEAFAADRVVAVHHDVLERGVAAARRTASAGRGRGGAA
jgi:glycosyltransferase involved in cell wall biosynthesis